MAEVEKRSRAEIMMPGVACTAEGAPHDRSSAYAQQLARRACAKCLQEGMCRKQAPEIAAFLGATDSIIVGGVAVTAEVAAIAQAQQQEPAFEFKLGKIPSETSEATQYFRVLYRRASKVGLRSLEGIEERMLPALVGMLETPEGTLTHEEITAISTKITQTVCSPGSFPLSDIHAIAQGIISDTENRIAKGMGREQAINQALKFPEAVARPGSTPRPRKKPPRFGKVETKQSTVPIEVRTKQLEHKRLTFILGKETPLSTEGINRLSKTHTDNIVFALEHSQERISNQNVFNRARQVAWKNLEQRFTFAENDYTYGDIEQLLSAELIMAISTNSSIRRSPDLGMHIAATFHKLSFSEQIDALEDIENFLTEGVLVVDRSQEHPAFRLNPILQELSDDELSMLLATDNLGVVLGAQSHSESMKKEFDDEEMAALKAKVADILLLHQEAVDSPLEQEIRELLFETISHFGGRYSEDKEWLLEQLQDYCSIEPNGSMYDAKFLKVLKSLRKNYQGYLRNRDDNIPLTTGELLLAEMYVQVKDEGTVLCPYSEAARRLDLDPKQESAREALAIALDECLESIEWEKRQSEHRKAIVRQSRMNDPEVASLLARIPRAPDNIGEINVAFAKRVEAGREAEEILQGVRPLPVSLAEKYGNADDKQIPLELKVYLESITRDGKRAKQEFTEANIRLAVSVALKSRFKGRGLPPIDLVHHGILGVMRAVEKYDYRRGTTFSTYATHWIIQRINRAIAFTARPVRLPIHVEQARGQLYRTQKKLEDELGREPSDKEIASVLGMTPQKVSMLRNTGKSIASFSAPISAQNNEPSDRTLGDAIASSHAVEDDYEETLNHDLRNVLSRLRRTAYPKPIKGTVGYTAKKAEYMRMLTENEFHILWLLHGFDGEPLTSKQVSERLNLNRTSVSKYRRSGLAKLKAHLLETLNS